MDWQLIIGITAAAVVWTVGIFVTLKITRRSDSANDSDAY